MRYDERLANQKRHEIWSELCDLADRLSELSARWWNEDTDLVDAHYDRCQIKSSAPVPDSNNHSEIDDDDF